MARRFGGVDYRQRRRKQKFIAVAAAGSLGLLLLALVVLLVVIDGEQVNAAVPSYDTSPMYVAAATPQSSVAILVARTRIEEGTALSEELFTEQPWDESTLPIGSIMLEPFRNRLQQKRLFATHLIPANVPLLEQSLTEIAPVSTFNIPPGSRAVSILVDSRTSVEGFASPGTRVDVLFTSIGSDSKQSLVKTLVHAAQVLSLSGETQRQQNDAAGASAQIDRGATLGATTATLLVTSRQAKLIELARGMGTLSLARLGGEETLHASGQTEDTIRFSDIYGSEESEDWSNTEPQNIAYIYDQKSGKQQKFFIDNNTWKRAK